MKRILGIHFISLIRVWDVSKQKSYIFTISQFSLIATEVVNKNLPLLVRECMETTNTGRLCVLSLVLKNLQGSYMNYVTISIKMKMLYSKNTIKCCVKSQNCLSAADRKSQYHSADVCCLLIPNSLSQV